MKHLFNVPIRCGKKRPKLLGVFNKQPLAFIAQRTLDLMARPFEPPHNPATGHSHDRELLIQEMLSTSSSSVWEEARLEWELFDVYEDANMTHCLCGHEIMERCVLRNRITECDALVGNSCVKQFMSDLVVDIPTNAIFASIKRVKKSPGKAVHKHLVKMAKEKRRITGWAESWYVKHSRKRDLTAREMAYRRRLNRRILAEPEEPQEMQEATAVETVASERFCMPCGEPWTLDEQLLQQAREDGRLTEWEVKFYKDNYYKGYVSEKQAPIKRRIEELTLPTPWVLKEDVLQWALGHRFISSWDYEFYVSNAEQQRFTDKQAAIKWRIEDKVQSVASCRGQWPL